MDLQGIYRKSQFYHVIKEAEDKIANLDYEYNDEEVGEGDKIEKNCPIQSIQAKIFNEVGIEVKATHHPINKMNPHVTVRRLKK